MRSAFITGVSREEGLGTALVRQYLGEGYAVFAASRNLTSEHLRTLAEEYPDRLFLVELDVSLADSVRAAADVIREKTGRLDVLISNATSSSAAGNLPIDEGMDVEALPRAYDVNVLGFLRMAQAFLPMMGEGGRIAAITSEAGSMGGCHRDMNIDYGAAKAALNFCCVTLQRRLGGRGMRVLTIHPGWVQTRPAPPKADLTPGESAAHIFRTIQSPPPFCEEGNTGVFVNYDGTHYPF